MIHDGVQGYGLDRYRPFASARRFPSAQVPQPPCPTIPCY